MSKFPATLIDQEINGVVLVKNDVFSENRGYAYTLYNKDDYDIEFVEQKISVTKDGWARGLHADDKNFKLITCVGGIFSLILLDGRISSSTYGKNSQYQLKYNCGTQVLVPPGVYNGHFSIAGECVLHYAWSYGYEGQETQKTVSLLDLGVFSMCL